jgi:hypothetical protein
MEAESMPIADLLGSQRRWGTTRCRKFLAAIPMSETKTIGSMTERQRRELAMRLERLGVAARAERSIELTPSGSLMEIAV